MKLRCAASAIWVAPAARSVPSPCSTRIKQKEHVVGGTERGRHFADTDRKIKRHVRLALPGRSPPPAAPRPRRWRLPQRLTAACHSSSQQGTARLHAAWTCRAGWVRLKPSGRGWLGKASRDCSSIPVLSRCATPTLLTGVGAWLRY
jgi:hypothetical protein